MSKTGIGIALNPLMMTYVWFVLASQILPAGPTENAEQKNAVKSSQSTMRTIAQNYLKRRKEIAEIIGSVSGSLGAHTGRCMSSIIGGLRTTKSLPLDPQNAPKAEVEALTSLLTAVQKLRLALDTLLPEDEVYWQKILREHSKSQAISHVLHSEAVQLIDFAADGLTGLGEQGPLSTETLAQKEQQQREVAQSLQALEVIITSHLNPDSTSAPHSKTNSSQTSRAQNKRKESTQ